MDTKVCTKCFNEKILDEFYVRKSGRHVGQCKECIKQIRKDHYTNNTELIKNRALNYYYTNHEEAKAKRLQYRNNHRDEAIERCKEWADNNREYKRAKDREYYALNPDRYKLNSINRRLKLLNATWPSDWECTEEWWDTLKTKYDNKCAYCYIDCAETNHGKPTMEHIIPISRGGLHAEHNIVPACMPCNDSKHDKLPYEWGKIPMFLDEGVN